MESLDNKSYEKFLESKRINAIPSGIEVARFDLHNGLYPFQKDITRWALARGKAAIFDKTKPLAQTYRRG